LSFGGTAIDEHPELKVSFEDNFTQLRIANAFDLNTFIRWWPRYEASGKHRKDGYFREGGEWVSPMPLDAHTAQTVLITSVLDGSDRFGYYQGQYYRFARTHADKEIFHGFSITRDEVPVGILQVIER
jgi:hypothetical protein